MLGITPKPDLKSLQIIRLHHERIVRSKHDETDILVLLIMLREVVPDDCPIREIAHFVAHRHRDRGEFHRYIIAKAGTPIPVQGSGSDDSLSEYLSKNPVYNQETIFSALNSGFATCRLPPLAPSLCTEVMMCIISLMQDIRFVHKGSNVGHTMFCSSNDRIALLAEYQTPDGESVAVTILSTNNPSYLPDPSDPSNDDDFGLLPNDGTVFRIVNAGGSLCIQP